MKIYFCGSIRGGRDDACLYQHVVKTLVKFGKVLTEHVGDSELTDTGEQWQDSAIHDRDLEWLKQADVVVAEVTQPSLGVGYELGHAYLMKKRILCLFRPSSGFKLSAMIRGAADGERMLVMDYNGRDDVDNILDNFFKT
ncbi:2'-deoxynucleoside 5'-phosphate N-hydrolase 1 [Syngnathoides biaculeatus]|uniref:2'-deoxynucleoside 5'-phosphate N-hydrolase 1 n=1 Tax=Syngnathoides biaculeatus TaxID=300417 RepID=UPI002ADDCCC1|nr:2'-deoxynucleoside 5'-phosphate N-hydrolase 1 [Syngnathoides biaculeatus]XP_061694151.1 2'-deoxynucleoside 5'-phosphate N-hydrolase 1 [Syngnathoides biaculeatus]